MSAADVESDRMDTLVDSAPASSSNGSIHFSYHHQQQSSNVKMTHVNGTLDQPSYGHNNNRLEKLQPTSNGVLLKPAAVTAGSTNLRDSSPVDEDRSARQSLILLLAIFLASLFAMLYVYAMFPQLDESEKQYIKVPFDIEDAKQLGRVLDRYKDLYNLEVMFGIILVYIFLQTFAIPGSLFLSILSGFLYSFPVALTLVCFCSALGATLCYLLSQLVGRRLVKFYFPERARLWASQVDRHRDDLLSYMLFLRMTPFLPNWFINLVAPVIGVPLYPFALGTFLGVAPPSFIAIQAGKTLYKMTSSSDAFSWGSIVMLASFSIVALVPAIFKRYFKTKIG
ncbi:transmembrane protein 41B [Anopheles bellator]|uniref:transmembrane protein 41B n=1 Tax=Anopheles bellator TaxID=139047 RepID=UPI00264A0A73|nr:transmembrane protein 41B [Anopheles bellator]